MSRRPLAIAAMLTISLPCPALPTTPITTAMRTAMVMRTAMAMRTRRRAMPWRAGDMVAAAPVCRRASRACALPHFRSGRPSCGWRHECRRHPPSGCDAWLWPPPGCASSQRGSRRRRDARHCRAERGWKIHPSQGYCRRACTTLGRNRPCGRTAAAQSPICRSWPRLTAPSPCPSSTWSRWGCGAAPACSAALAARKGHACRGAGRCRPHRLRGSHHRHALSGGQLQRALFARLLLQDADIILLE